MIDAFALAARHRRTHILDDFGRFVKKSDETDFKLSEAFSVLKSKRKAQDKFNGPLKNAYEPGGIIAVFEKHKAALRYADYVADGQGDERIYCQDRFSIASEPTRYEQTLPGVCPDGYMK